MDQCTRRNNVAVDSLLFGVKKRKLKGKCIEVLEENRH